VGLSGSMHYSCIIILFIDIFFQIHQHIIQLVNSHVLDVDDLGRRLLPGRGDYILRDVQVILATLELYQNGSEVDILGEVSA